MDLRELLDVPGVTEDCILRSEVGFMALHGGSQDRGTDHIARRAAERANASYYAIVQPPHLRVHLTSRLHDPAHSPALRRFLDHVQIVLSIHGFGRDSLTLRVDSRLGPVIEPYGPPRRGTQTRPLTGIIVGGLNAPLLEQARTAFDNRFDGYHVADERLRLGFHPENPVNLPAHHGVQIELPPGLRGIGPYGERLTPDPDAIPEDLITTLVELAGHATRLATSADCHDKENVF